MLLLNACSFSGEYVAEYIVLLLSYLFVGGLLLTAVIYRDADIFEPIILIYILMIGQFSIAPIILTSSGTTSLYGVDFMDGCIKATLIYMGACLAFSIGYYSKSAERCGHYHTDLRINIKSRSLCLQIMVIVWVICFFIGVWYEVFCLGRSFAYIMSLGQLGQIDASNTIETSLAFLINFAYSLIIPWLYIMFVSHNKMLKIATTVAMLALYIVCGWRFILVIMGLSFTTVYYVNKNKHISMIKVLIALFVAVVAFTVIGNSRNALRSGTENTWIFDTDSMLFMFESNFNLYQPFYGVVTHYPSQYMYTFGEGMIFDTLITFIPRAIWPGKPLARNFASIRAIRNSVGNAVIDKAAMAMPCIGEMYVDFGIIGVLIISLFLGRLLKKIVRMYQSERLTFENLLIYAPAYALCFQFVTRGYMPNNFYLAVFVLWPGILLRYLVSKSSNLIPEEEI